MADLVAGRETLAAATDRLGWSGEALADAEERFRLLVDAVTDYAIFLLDPEGRVVSWNPGAVRLKGYASEEILGKHFSVFYPPEDIAAGKPGRELDEAKHGGSCVDEGWRVRKDGTRFWAHAVITALRGADGALRGFAKVTRDDTEARAARERGLALQEITGALLGGRDAADVLSLIASHARVLAGAACAWITVPDPDGAGLVIAAADGAGFGPQAGDRFPAAGTVSESVMTGRVPRLVSDFPAASAAGEHFIKFGAALAVPLLAGPKAIGVLTAASAAGGPSFRALDLDVLGVFAAQAAVVLEYDRAQQALRSQLVAADRERIARDLHDHVIQHLFAAGMTVQSTALRIADSQVRATLERTVDELDETIRQLRTAVFELHHPVARERSARDAVLAVVREVARPLGFEPQLYLHGPLDTALPEHYVEHMIAALREMLSNVARHARARSASVEIAVGDELVVDVTDDGVGVPDAVSAGDGLTNLRGRATQLHGQFTMQPRPDGGTLASWRVPLPP